MKNCNQCGKCCINYADGGLVASVDDLERWEEYRPDIFQYVRDGNIWMHPESGEQFGHCPWLRAMPDGKYECAIYEDRPEDCRHFPVTIEQMIRNDCEMLESRDLNNICRAQRDLDRIMADSRPPAGRR